MGRRGLAVVLALTSQTEVLSIHWPLAYANPMQDALSNGEFAGYRPFVSRQLYMSMLVVT